MKNGFAVPEFGSALKKFLKPLYSISHFYRYRGVLSTRKLKPRAWMFRPWESIPSQTTQVLIVIHFQHLYSKRWTSFSSHIERTC